ncbi:S-adenosyl-L-methionine-dependent methyltransferase [Lentinula raphanica]|uniref:S-adenosyl-L-methionine-dependent methyltransferase n=1 Tax=Lentinula raphanica TaxID=153919 RepID=A0AA38P6G2_9AGAR|nr:S-adenosyl-L-methionine-dependent methyltransferase [Lentinula raphanica]KAJ3837185.1 S-adenosyl-L-methionine-dependent methyltransferase [Lentinula raphanica]
MSSFEHHHHGHHGRNDAEDQNRDYVEANRAHSDSSNLVELLDEHPVFVEFADTVGKAMREIFPFDPNNTIALDFACGTGLSARSYAPYVKSVLGVDISQKSLDIYNKQALAKGFADKMTCVCIELKGNEGELDGVKFDVVTCVMAYHHFASAKDTTVMLAKLLKPGGMLLIVDIEAPSAHDPHAEPAAVIDGMQGLNHVANKHGYTTEDIQEIFEGAGLVSFDMKHLAHIELKDSSFGADTFMAKGFDVDTFMAQGVKPMEGC